MRKENQKEVIRMNYFILLIISNLSFLIYAIQMEYKLLIYVSIFGLIFSIMGFLELFPRGSDD